jgi:MFS transporter, UMF1 family
MKKIISWALYDWANSAFATSVMAGLFPVFFKRYWSAGADVSESTLQLGTANSVASLMIAVLAPLLGAIADRGGIKKRLLLLFAILGITMTGCLSLVSRGEWEIAAGLYMLAVIGFSGGNIFYDSLMVSVAPEEKKRDSVSALGFSLGYLGGGLVLSLNILMIRMPEIFGFESSTEATRISFTSVAIWWALFSLPLFLIVDEPVTGEQSRRVPVAAGYRQIISSFRKIRRLRVVALFLLAYWLYIDGVGTIIRMALDYGMALGFAPESLLTALLITQFVGFPSTIAFGRIGERFGAKRGILLGLGVYAGVVLWGFTMDREWEFYALASAIGAVQGGVQSLSRSLYSRIIPASQAGEFFGFYNLFGKSAAIIGPALMGLVSFVTDSPRYSILSVGILFVCGAAILCLVDEEEGSRLAVDLED